MGIEEYLTEIKNQIRDKKAREFASDELKAHIEDRACFFSADGDYASFFQSRHHQYHNRLHPPRLCPVNLQIPGHPRGKRACNHIIGIIRKIFDINPGDNLIVP